MDRGDRSHAAESAERRRCAVMPWRLVVPTRPGVAGWTEATAPTRGRACLERTKATDSAVRGIWLLIWGRAVWEWTMAKESLSEEDHFAGENEAMP